VKVGVSKQQSATTPSAIGIRVHSGWGALVAVSGKAGAEEVIDRRRLSIVDPKTAGGIQPYHFAKNLGIREGETHVVRCLAASARLALQAVREVVDQLRNRGYHVAGAAILLSSGKPLPAFEKILASHALIHTAEGEFFRQAFRESFASLEIPVTGIRERELEERATAVFGKAAPRLQQRIAGLGRILGPPWSQDQKAAAVAALVVLDTGA
jgi:hypothetical protein